MIANTSSRAMYTEPDILSRLLMNSANVLSWRTTASPNSALTESASARKPTTNDRPGSAISGKRRNMYPAATKITVAMTGISASSAQRSPMRGTSIGARKTPSTKPVPSTIAKYTSAARIVFDIGGDYEGVGLRRLTFDLSGLSLAKPLKEGVTPNRAHLTFPSVVSSTTNNERISCANCVVRLRSSAASLRFSIVPFATLRPAHLETCCRVALTYAIFQLPKIAAGTSPSLKVMTDPWRTSRRILTISSCTRTFSPSRICRNIPSA